MIVSEARIAANRRNAQLSTGPRTEEGKARSRANALKHGLCSSVVVAEDARLVQDRAHDFFGALRPQGHFHAWLVTEVALLSLRIERCERIERRLRDRAAIAAEVSWEDDRRSEAARLGAMLGHRPDPAVDQLRRTPQGCEWLMTRWAMLARAADVKGQWTPEQERLAFDLLGTPAEFREGHAPGEALDFEGHVADPAEGPAAVARREVAALKERREAVSGLDEAARALAGADLGNDSDPDLRRLRRYESTLHGRLRWCLKQLQTPVPEADSPRGLRAEWLGQREPSPRPEPAPAPAAATGPAPTPTAPRSWHPPFDLEEHEVPGPGETLDVPKILASREERRIKRAGSRREARRRKLERLRA